MNNSGPIRKSYKLPWTTLDNPNGWIEPTTHCNISCPECYRGLDKPGLKREHLPLAELMAQVDWFVAHRKVHTISIAGGEPLMYPHLEPLIQYIAGLNLRIMLYTNGYLLTEARAQRLSALGLTQLVIHVDRFQQRPDLVSESPMELRLRYVRMMQAVPKLRLGFIQPISSNCHHELAAVMAFLKAHFSNINLMVFTVYRNICESPGQQTELSNELSVAQLMQLINQHSPFVPTAMLGSASQGDDPTWLFAQRMGTSGKIFGSLSPAFYRLAHRTYRKKTGKHLFISKSNAVRAIKLVKYMPWLSVARIMANFLLNGLRTGNWHGGKINFQTLLILRGPEKQNGKWDLCDGCPDSIIHKGKLVPSCILENLRDKPNQEFQNVNIQS